MTMSMSPTKISTSHEEPVGRARRGQFPVTEVTIINDDTPGEFTRGPDRRSDGGCKRNMPHVKRKNGSDGQLMLDYTTVEGTAKQSTDYTHTKGHSTLSTWRRKRSSRFPPGGQAQDKTLDFEVHFDIVGYPQCGAKYGEFRKCDVSIAVDISFKIR